MQSSLFTNIIRKIRSKAKNTKAQSAIEIGLVMPVILILVLGSFDIAKICVTYLDLNSVLSYNLSELMKDNSPGAQMKHLQAMEREYDEKAFFKGSFNVERLGPYPPGARNTIGTVWCADGSVYIPLTYTKLFNYDKFGGPKNSRMAKISKRVCSLQEVATIR